MKAIETINLTKKYKDTVAVDNLNLEIEEGELFALLGVNGAGKTTTIKMLCGLCPITEGDALLNGKSIKSKAGEIKNIIAVSPQESAVAPNLTVRENLALMCGIHGFDRQKSEQKIDTLLTRLDLKSVINKKSSKLSGGYLRRLSIAMALISEPKILFLDEPTLGLDVISRSELWEVIRQLKENTTIVLTTHYMGEAEALSDRIAIMKNGKLLALGTADQLKKAAGTTDFEQAFIEIVKGVKE